MIDTASFKSAVAMEIEGAIHFRQERAERFPEDERNQRCADSLQKLADGLDALSEDDLTLVRTSNIYFGKHKTAGNDPSPDSGLWWPREEYEAGSVGFTAKSTFSRYGFDAPESGDPREFLNDLASEIEGWNAEDLRLKD